MRNLIGFPEKSETEEVEEVEPVGSLPQDESDESVDNGKWINKQAKEKQDLIRQEFAEKPWLKRVDFQLVENVMEGFEKPFVEDMLLPMARIKDSFEKQLEKISKGRSFGNIPVKFSSSLSFLTSSTNSFICLLVSCFSSLVLPTIWAFMPSISILLLL